MSKEHYIFNGYVVDMIKVSTCGSGDEREFFAFIHLSSKDANSNYLSFISREIRDAEHSSFGGLSYPFQLCDGEHILTGSTCPFSSPSIDTDCSVGKFNVVMTFKVKDHPKVEMYDHA
ncbi:hypothetical protein PP411_gp59 [Vibrio phage vB_VpP_BT-1011]|uniref:Uncharacterized protein n=1 Tax=Vibrio phage vB_VpP_BT-1011 TaxID=2799672 RepID=A0A8F3BEJ0_9CAUD|nr:hypothetical protein PP411_gp59 [Vibrio phage vB_VpP_BT-1011]QWX10258.1 hypothetical protein vBVpPBT1011_0059 [Vibrio phage vB_VpP_BT-1011]